MPQARRKRHAIARVPRQDVLEKMNALITPHLFSGTPSEIGRYYKEKEK
jgi:hypothetical protein